MKHRKRSKVTDLFLLELILAILFFAIASAVCVRIFVKAHSLSEEAQISTWAVTECAGFAEIICASDDPDEALSVIRDEYPEYADGSIYYDKDFRSCKKSDAVYYIKLEVSRNSKGMLIGDIVACGENSDSYYELHPQHYIGNAKADSDTAIGSQGGEE